MCQVSFAARRQNTHHFVNDIRTISSNDVQLVTINGNPEGKSHGGHNHPEPVLAVFLYSKHIQRDTRILWGIGPVVEPP